MAGQLEGSCLCGACGLTATPADMAMSACHCGMCRKWSGGVFMSVDCGNSVTIAEDAPVGRYRASAWGERVFCTNCGSNLVWQTQDGRYQHVSPHVFDNPDAFAFTMQVFIDRKPANYAFANETGTMTEAEVLAMFASPPGEHG